MAALKLELGSAYLHIKIESICPSVFATVSRESAIAATF